MATVDGTQSVKARVDKILANKLGVDIDRIRPESSLRENFGADSLDVVEIVMDVEREFDLEISPEEMDRLHVVNDVHELIEGRIDA